MDTHTKSSNVIRCAYCRWTTLRFRGRKTYDFRGMSYGERQLRLHVIDEHYDLYLQAQGLVESLDDRPWTIDVAEIGEQPL